MDTHTLRLIAGDDTEIWRLFSVLNKAMNAEFNMYKYELTFRKIIKNNNTISYHLNGKLHRTDGPAFEYVDVKYSRISWHIHGVLHRINGPALIYGRNYEFEKWYMNGKLHRENGPAWITPTSTRYFINGESMNKSDYMRRNGDNSQTCAII